MLKRKVMILMFLVVFCLVPAATRPETRPSPDPKPLVVPETSKVGFSKVDLNKAPDVVKNIAGIWPKRNGNLAPG